MVRNCLAAMKAVEIMETVVGSERYDQARGRAQERGDYNVDFWWEAKEARSMFVDLVLVWSKIFRPQFLENGKT
jgi:hypothetical protein